jgi:hypothetical protein
MEPTLKLPGTKRLKLKCEGPLSNFGFKFKLRRYNAARADVVAAILARRILHIGPDPPADAPSAAAGAASGAASEEAAGREGEETGDGGAAAAAQSVGPGRYCSCSPRHQHALETSYFDFDLNGILRPGE